MKRKRFSSLLIVFLALSILGGNVQYLHGSDSAPKTQSDRQYDPGLVFAELERAVKSALDTYSNVHRGDGQYSKASTELFEHARSIVREYLGLGDDYEIIFASCREIDILINKLKQKEGYKALYSDKETGLRFGVGALAVKKELLPDTPPVVGGGEVDDVSDNSVAWTEAPAKFEPGTPNIIGVIAFAKALSLMRKVNDKDIFRKAMAERHVKKTEADPFAGLSGLELLPKVRETLVGKSELVPSEEGMLRYINLDNGASTPTFTPIMKSAFDALQATDEEVKKIVSDARAECATYFHAPETEYECIFSSNTTESINIAAEIAATFREDGVEPVVIGTDIEHNSNELPWRNSTLLHAPVNDDGFIDVAVMETFLKEYNETKAHGNKRICIVTVSGASNVLGTFNDIGAICKLAHKYGAYFHADGAQLSAHKEVDMASLGIDLLSCSAHKMYAPFGSGGLVARKSLLQRFGEEKLRRVRAYGERNVMGIAAFKTSMRILNKIGLDVLENEERSLTARVLRGLSGINSKYGEDTILIFGIDDPNKLANKGPVVCFHVDGIPHNIVGARLAEIRGIGVRTGCFCAQRLLKFLFSVRGKDVSELVRQGKTPGLVRVSIGLENTEEDIDEFLRILVKIINDPDSKKFIPGDSDCRYCAGKSLVTHEISKQIDAFVQGAVHNVYDVDMKRLIK